MRSMLAVALASCIAAVGAAEGTRAASRNNNYTCSPGWPEGDSLVIDWVKLHVQFPNGSEMDMTDLNAASGFRIGEADVEISGKDTDRITVQEGGEPDQTCVPE